MISLKRMVKLVLTGLWIGAIHLNIGTTSITLGISTSKIFYNTNLTKNHKLLHNSKMK